MNNLHHTKQSSKTIASLVPEMLELFGQTFWKRTEIKHDHFKRVTYQRDAGGGLHRITMTWACLDALPWPEREKKKSNILAFKEKAVWQSAKQLGIQTHSLWRLNVEAAALKVPTLAVRSLISVCSIPVKLLAQKTWRKMLKTDVNPLNVWETGGGGFFLMCTDFGSMCHN